MQYTNQFIDTCFSFDEEQKLRYAFGAALYKAKEIMGKMIVLYGKAGSGKSSILDSFQAFSADRKIWIYHDFDLKRLNKLWIGNDEVVFAATNRPPEEYDLPDYVYIIRTTGNVIPLEDWKKFKQEMWYCPEEFFRRCMVHYSLYNHNANMNGIKDPEEIWNKLFKGET